jgi:hypothetical protein
VLKIKQPAAEDRGYNKRDEQGRPQKEGQSSREEEQEQKEFYPEKEEIMRKGLRYVQTYDAVNITGNSSFCVISTASTLVPPSSPVAAWIALL